MPKTKTTLWPSRKWFASTVVAYTGLLTTWATTGWDKSVTLMAITVTSGAAVSYLLPNSDRESIGRRRP